MRKMVTVVATVTMALGKSEDIVRMRQTVRQHAVAQGFSLVDQTKLVTAASELARNTVEYGGGGDVEIADLVNGIRKGVRLTFVDHGPGIPDIDLALKDGYTSGRGLGLGLGGAKRLCDEFSIDSRAGEGTRIMIARWR
jgi:serine/threonine-protein kinase RsbT